MADVPATISEAAEWLRKGRITSLRLTEILLERAHASQDSVAAFITITDESALVAAQRADAELASGVDRGPLHGVPLGIKDIIATVDAPTTANSNVLDPAWGTRDDATVIRKLREAGAVLMGKLGLAEFACGMPDPATGFRIPRNPWDLARSPGGSSSGTGAAIAAGLILGGLGTDTGGSIRNPAGWCGISGIKPTFGRVSKEGCVPLGYSLDNIGPMARTARDCALMLQVLAGYDAADPCSAPVPVPPMTDRLGVRPTSDMREANSGRTPFTRLPRGAAMTVAEDFLAAPLGGSLTGVRIGIPRDAFFTEAALDAEVAETVLSAVNRMAAEGAIVVDLSLPHAPLGDAVLLATMLPEAYAYHEPDLLSRPEVYGKYTRQMLLLGSHYTGADYVQAQRLRSVITSECLSAISDVDVIVVPTALKTAPLLDEVDPERLLRDPIYFTGLWNVTGFPALSICCGFSGAGLPIGLQLVGKPFDEPTLFAVGDQYQQITDWHTRVPALAMEPVLV
jgi:aspartyl-tRNA(Asn)/glutamyl-tRNA(Gln) amidotransferase subunit A